MSKQHSRNQRSLWKCVAAVCGLLLAFSSEIRAQSTFGTVLGTVKESTGAVVPNAKVQLLNKGTNASRATVTDQTGTFEFSNIDVGTYEVTIEAVGFGTQQITGVSLTSRETKRLDAELKLATQQTTVNVESAGHGGGAN